MQRSPAIRVRKRKDRGRSRQGCHTCRARHVKCDEDYPCGQCRRLNYFCPGNIQAPNNGVIETVKTISTAPAVTGRSFHETGIFLKFILSLSPSLGGYFDESFWRAIVPASVEHDYIFRAVLAVGVVYDLPMALITDPNTLPRFVSQKLRDRYMEAQEWYNASLSQSIKATMNGTDSITPITLMLLTTIMYVYAESRQSHPKSLHHLYKAAFAVIHSARSKLMNCKDNVVLACLARILDFGFNTRLDGLQVPETHWKAAIIIGLKIAADIGASDLYRIQFELNMIQYDINRVTRSKRNLDDSITGQHMLKRVQKWTESVEEYMAEGTLTPQMRIHLARLQCLVPLYKTRWRIWYSNNDTINWDLYRVPISHYMTYFETMLRISHNPPYAGPIPLYLLEMCWAPNIICGVWHCREQPLVERCKEMLEKFRWWEQDRYLDSIIQYLQVLCITKHDQVTDIELQLFGKTPMSSLLLHQAHQISEYLLVMSGQSSDESYVENAKDIPTAYARNPFYKSNKKG